MPFRRKRDRRRQRISAVLLWWPRLAWLRHRSSLRIRIGLGNVEIRTRVCGLGSGLEPLFLRLGLARLGLVECLFGGSEIGVGRGFLPFCLAQRRFGGSRLALRCLGGLLRLVGRFGGLDRLSGKRLGPRRSRSNGLRVRNRQRRVRELGGRGIVRRDDHPHADPRFVEQLFRKAVRHAHAAVRGGIPRQRTTMQRNAVPGEALHVRHRGIVIEGRVVV